MPRWLIAGLPAGIAFLVLDGALNANPLARHLYAAYQPIARPSVNALAGSIIDLGFGVALAWLFTTLRPSLPGRGRLAKAVSFGFAVWFLRVGMRVAGDWVVTIVPVRVHAYTLLAGLVQVLLVSGVISALVSPPTGTSSSAPAGHDA